MSKIKVIFHIDEMSKWPLVLANTRNLINEMQDVLSEVEVLANSEAVLFFKNDNSDLKEQVLALSNKVKFCVCRNSMKSLKIEAKEIDDYISIVSSGVAYLAYQQNDGFAYIKP